MTLSYVNPQCSCRKRLRQISLLDRNEVIQVFKQRMFTYICFVMLYYSYSKLIQKKDPIFSRVVGKTFHSIFAEASVDKENLSMATELEMDTVENEGLDTLVTDESSGENPSNDVVMTDIGVENGERFKDIAGMSRESTTEETTMKDGETKTDPLLPAIGSQDMSSEDQVCEINETDADVTSSRELTETVGVTSSMAFLPATEDHRVSNEADNKTATDSMSEPAMLVPHNESQNDEVSENTVLEETGMTDEDLQGAKKQTLSAEKLVDRLGYRPMTLRIFKKMRDTFGSEECEYCGRLFFSRMDYEPHVRTHTGKCKGCFRTINVSVLFLCYVFKKSF